MMSADESSLQTLLSNLNIDAAPGYNGEKRVEKLVLQLGELSARYSDLAARYLKLVNSRVTESSDIGSLNDGAKGPFSETSSSHALNEIFAEFASEVGDCIPPGQFNLTTKRFSGDLGKALRLILQELKAKKTENASLSDVIKSLEHKCDSLDLLVKQMETEKVKHAESRVRSEFFSEFEGLIKEDLRKTHILQQKITESLVLIKNSHPNGDTAHIDAIFDSLMTELNLQEHLKKMIEKMNSRRLKQDQEIDALCERLSAMENSVIQYERDKMLFQNQKRVSENEKQELQDKMARLNSHIQEEHANVQKLQVDVETKKNAYSALNKAYEMNKNTLDQLKRKDSMVKKHISQQDSDISKLKGRIVDMEKQIKALKEEIQQKTQAIIALSSDKEVLIEQARSSSTLSSQYEEASKKIQTLSNSHEIEVNKLQGLLRSKQEEKDQIVAAYSKLIKGYDGLKKEFGSLKAEHSRVREKLEKIRLQSMPSELKAEFEKELGMLRAENQRLCAAYNSMEVEKNKWREMLELDNSKASSLAAKISALETENDSLRMQRGGSSADGAQLNEERRKNRMLETECENLNRRVWDLTEQLNRVKDEQFRVTEMLRNNWSSQSIRVGDKIGETSIDSYVSPLNGKNHQFRRSEPDFMNSSQGTNAFDDAGDQKFFEDENKRLMEIVAQVKSDLRQAASQSPSTSVFSP